MSIVAYEQRRIRTIRSTWIIIALTLVLAGGLAAGTAALANLDPATGTRGAPGALTTVLGALASPILLVPLSVMAAMAFGGEYRFGLIRITLTEFPRRTRVFFGKLWVVLLWMALTLIVSLVVILAVAWLFRSNVRWDPATVTNAAYVGRAVLYALGYCLFTFALVLITRNQALSIVLVIVWTLIVESLLVGFLGSRIEWLNKVMPMTSGMAFVNGDDMLRNGLVFGAYLLVFLLFGWFLLLRRDA